MQEKEKELLQEQLEFLQSQFNKISVIDCLKTAENFTVYRHLHPMEVYLYKITITDTIDTAYEKIMKVHTKALKNLELEIHTYKKLLEND